MNLFLALCVLTSSLATPAEGGYKQCQTDSQCNQSAGEVCLKRFSGCHVGTCLCLEGMDTDSRGNCRRRKLGGESCSKDDVCASDMPCVDGRCRCDGELTPDKTFCLRPNQRMVGETCHSSDVCLQQIGSRYTSNDVQCKSGECRCVQGFKQSGFTCRKWEIGESGCMEDDHCHGGALCTDNMCQCPEGYNVRADGTKCTRKTAIVDLDLGQPCNEVHEERYCGANLICHSCGGAQRCLQSRSNAQASIGSSSPSVHQRARVMLIAVSLSIYTAVYSR